MPEKKKFRVFATSRIGDPTENRLRQQGYELEVFQGPEATAEFGFFMMGILARKMYLSEKLVREQRWPSWHPFLPFLGDEVTGKTIAIIGTGRIGLAMIKKCAGFDMNILCYDPLYQNHEFIKAIQEIKDLRYARGICKEKTWIRYTVLDEALTQADFVSVH